MHVFRLHFKKIELYRPTLNTNAITYSNLYEIRCNKKKWKVDSMEVHTQLVLGKYKVV